MGNAAGRRSVAAAEPSEQQRLEALLANDLLTLRRSFARLAVLSDSAQGLVPRSALEKRLQLFPTSLAEGLLATETELGKAAQRLGPVLVERVYGGSSEFDWESFLKGTAICCKEPSSAARLALLVSLFASFPQRHTERETEGRTGAHDQPIEKSDAGMVKEGSWGAVTLEGSWFDTQGLEVFFLVCWLLFCHVRLARSGGMQAASVRLVDVEPLIEGVRDAVTQAKENGGANAELSRMPADRIVSWIVSALPGLCDCLSDFVHLRLVEEVPDEQAASLEQGRSRNNSRNSSPPACHREDDDGVNGEASMGLGTSSGLLSTTTAWMLGLSQRGATASTLLGISCDPAGWHKFHPQLLYRSSMHGRGIKRFFSKVEGYRDNVLLLLSATTRPATAEANGEVRSSERWMMAVIVPTGVENRETFYGGSGCCMVALQPRFLVLRALGRESNFVYSHARLPGQGYRSVPKPQGLGFGGSSGRERVWVDEDFSAVIVRHHATDHTYQSGGLVPDQGYGPMESKLEELEAWGLGGQEAVEKLTAYQQREMLFTEQRAKIDLKKFGTDWESSPDKMMLDMVSDPNKPAREER